MRRPFDISGEPRRLGDLGPRVLRVSGTIGAVALLACLPAAYLMHDGLPRFFHAYLVSFCYFLSLALGALFFVLLQHVTRSGWSVVLRRLAEGIACTLPLLGLLCVPVLIGMHELYHWTHAEGVAHDDVLSGKRPYLNVPFFVGRVVFYFAVWSLLARYFFSASVRQDRSGDVALTVRMQKVSAPAMVLFALTVTFASFDFLMSLDAHWYSTIFGVYYFSGAVVGFFALLTVVAALVQSAGRLTRAVTIEHYHDLGKLLFAFVIFWAYIGFSQYMLIWYANIPEETVWYLHRQSGGWAAVSLALLFGHFIVPFLWLISRPAKRRKPLLVSAAVWLLALHWVDVYWLVMPDAQPQLVAPSVFDALCFIGIGGLFVAAAAYVLRDHSIIPERDPRLFESLTFENV